MPYKRQKMFPKAERAHSWAVRPFRFWEHLLSSHRKAVSSRPFPDTASQKKAPAGAFFKTGYVNEVATATSSRSPSLGNLRAIANRAVAAYISSHTRCENATGSSGRMPSTSSAWS